MANEYNIPECSPGEVADSYTDIYYNAWLGGELARCPTLMLWGEPGIGKTSIVQQIADNLSDRIGIQIEVRCILLLLRAPTDMMGLPVVSRDRSCVHWVRPEEFLNLPHDRPCILLLDEISNASPAMQAVAFEIALNRSIGGYALPDNLIIICAGNHTREGILAPLSNRMQHMELVADFDSWYAWALRSGIDPRVVAYLSFDRSKLYVKPGRRDIAFPSPRSWEFVSRTLKLMPEKSPSQLHAQLSGSIGASHAAEFEAFCGIWKDLPSVEDILSGKAKRLKIRKADVLYAVSSSLLACASRRGDSLSPAELENMCGFALQFPSDFAALFFFGLEEILGKVKLMNVPSFLCWVSRSGCTSPT